eukprot:TRINITY_DN11409_c0_g1_i1.p1 TRINITY_DN11409_c0_g1~~TRINITY_DN11409_c0_g1_i1.p1  ORF type:complete len:439 (+),score=104.40 TRINITY_DN11409_c0_g1_i1:112-1428(+)
MNVPRTASGIGRAVPSTQNTTSAPRPFRPSAPVFEPAPMHHHPQMTPALFIPQQTVVSSAIGQPYTIYAVPTYYQPMTQMGPAMTNMMMAYNFHNQIKPKTNYMPHHTQMHPHATTPVQTNHVSTSRLFVPQENQTRYEGNFGFMTMAQDESELDEGSVEITEQPHMMKLGVKELYENIITHLQTNPRCPVSWLNRLLAKCHTAADFHKGIKAFLLFQAKLSPTTPETGTLLVKAACRAGVPEKALELLKDVEHVRIFPTLGGIHYLMINFSLKKDSKAVMDTFQVTKTRHLVPSARTYHILIRECVDSGNVDAAMKYAKDCQKQNIVPNRVTYNILMNGLRKQNKAQEILELRQQMDENKIEINDTTVKFTALAHMILGQVSQAVDTFFSYPDIQTKLAEFSEKFFVAEDTTPEEQKLVRDFFQACLLYTSPSPRDA